MKASVILLAGVAAILSVPALAADGMWTFDTADRGHPRLVFREGGKEVFSVGCGRAFGIYARYPFAEKKNGEATIAISNGKATMTFKGEIEEFDDAEATPTGFLQSDLGYSRSDPKLYGPAWQKQKNELLDLLDSGRPLTISAEDKRYALPKVVAPGWKAKFRKIC